MGSPEPERVTISSVPPFNFQWFHSARTVAVGTHSLRWVVRGRVGATWQKTQFSVQTLMGLRSRPRERPRRREGTGPKR